MLPSLLFLVVLQGSPVARTPRALCEDVQRIELSRERGSPREICVSPGLLTGFVFDAPVVVDLEEEVRFADVNRGRTGISFSPPVDGVKGEQFRLTARFADGAGVTFVLVLHSGQATRQVEVYRDERTRVSFQHEVAQERAKNQQLQREIERLRHDLGQLECEDPSGLWRLIASGTMDVAGIRGLLVPKESRRITDGAVTITHGHTYRSTTRLAVAVWLKNTSEEPWSVSTATLVNAQGEELPGIRFWQDGGSLVPHDSRVVVVEADTVPQGSQGEVTLHLREDGPRSVSLLQVRFPN